MMSLDTQRDVGGFSCPDSEVLPSPAVSVVQGRLGGDPHFGPVNIILQRPPLILPNKLLILDLNGFVCNSVKPQTGGSTRRFRTATVNGVHQGKHYLYFERPGYHKFFAECFKMFDVGIWTCAGPSRATEMMTLLFTEDERRQFKFVYDQTFCLDTKAQRPDVKDGAAPIFLKDLRTVWSSFKDLYDDRNTLLIDDSPLKALTNPPNTALFPSSYTTKGSNQDDIFLMSILLPYLTRLAGATDVRLFLKNKTPKWSLRNEALDLQRQNSTYCKLAHLRWQKEYKPRLSVLDLCGVEIDWDLRVMISNIGPLDKLSDGVMRFLSLKLGITFERIPELRSDPEVFLQNVLHARDRLGRFKCHGDKAHCSRDRNVDRQRNLLTCSNKHCLLCTVQ